MKFSLFFSQKLIPKNSKQVSKPVVAISIITVALGVCILLLTFAITTGFQKEIRDKAVGFGSHIEVVHFDNNYSYESSPVFISAELIDAIKQVQGVVHVQPFTTKAGIIKTENDVEGVLFKGIDADYDSLFFVKNLVNGTFLTLSDSATSNDVLVSETLAKKLRLDIGQKFMAFFVQNPVRQRMFTIKGIYNTGFETYDKTHIICDMAHLQKLNDWKNDCVGGLEILIDDFDKIDRMNETISDVLPYDLQSSTIIDRNRDVFDWIRLFDQNVLILIFLVVITTGVSLISTQLILSLEHISTIGLLKALGCTTSVIRNVFLFLSAKILGIGILAGNAVGLLFCFVQNYFHLIKMDPGKYYVSYIPVDVQWLHVLLINIGAVLISFAVLVIPAHFVARRTSAISALRIE
ncbi:MAG: ABC transporter permease [Lentimicrobiaceae bacterium]|nr:ABC transporter permease [Lentimicrobiaceae bacterium]